MLISGVMTFFEVVVLEEADAFSVSGGGFCVRGKARCEGVVRWEVIFAWEEGSRALRDREGVRIEVCFILCWSKIYILLTGKLLGTGTKAKGKKMS